MEFIVVYTRYWICFDFISYFQLYRESHEDTPDNTITPETQSQPDTQTNKQTNTQTIKPTNKTPDSINLEDVTMETKGGDGVISTTPDVISTTPDMMSTNSDMMSTNSDMMSTNSDMIVDNKAQAVSREDNDGVVLSNLEAKMTDETDKDEFNAMFHGGEDVDMENIQVSISHTIIWRKVIQRL